MEDGKISAVKDDCTVSASLASLYAEFPPKFGANGHDFLNDGASLPDQYKQHADSTTDTQFKKRINPLKIHLGKRPFADNSPPNNIPFKKKAPYVRRPSEPSNLSHSNTPRLTKPVSKKRIESNQYQNIPSQYANMLEDEKDKPVPRLVPKSQLSQFKKSAFEKGPQMKESSPSIPPTVKFKCRKCYSMAFNTLAMLKEHQLVCCTHTKEPAKTASNVDSAGGPSRVTRKVYLCSACGTYYENWNLFLHMREVHNRHICLFCLGMFSKAEKLSTHLTNKHNVQQCKYETKEDFLNLYNGTLYLMCCECDEICSEKDDFFNHDCNNVKPKPVPVLVSKKASKLNNVKQTKNMEMIVNGPANIVKDKKLACDIPKVDNRKDLNDTSLETMQFSSMVSQYNSLPTNASAAYNTSSYLATETMPHSEQNIHHHPSSVTSSSLSIPNGNQSSELLNREYHLDAAPNTSPVPRQPIIKFKELPPKPAPEKEGGIKLKLSLNSARSPVIINSTVDPTIGKKPHKPPTRVRRPPKRYEKGSASKRNSQSETELPRTPSIKMTICNKADKPFVNTTFYENNQETVLKTLLNNNIDSSSEKSPEHKPENVIKSTIYDNILEDTNTLNRVPKLTVRVPKELLDRDSSSDYSSGSETNDRLTMDEEVTYSQTPVTLAEPIVDKPESEKSIQEEPKQLETEIPSSDVSIDSRQTPNITEDTHHEASSQSDQEEIDVVSSADNKEAHYEPQVDEASLEDTLHENSEDPSSTLITETNPNGELSNQVVEPIDSENKGSNIDTIAESNCNDINVEDIPTESAIEELPVIDLNLDRPIDVYPLKDLLKVFLSNTMYNCVYCNHVRKIAVNCEQLSLHMALEHRFRATVDSITAEELMPETISAKVQATAEELKTVYINLDSYDSVDKYDDVKFDHVFECFQCYFKTAVHKDLYLHNRKMHQKTILLCVMCKTNFYSYSELLCHLCPGTNDSENDIKFRCCLCNVDSIPSSFRLMVHLRKVHNVCDVCLEFCHNQVRLTSHVWKHKLHHVCYRCGIAYRNKADITRHLFWKHGTESVFCKRCLQKKWPHVYHFCAPPAVFICDECSMHFTKAVCLKVHKRFHSEEYPHVCTEEGCTEKFVSKKLLMKHLEEKQRKLATVAIDEKLDKTKSEETNKEATPQDIPTIDLVDDDKPKEEPSESAGNNESTSEQISKKGRKKRNKDKDALLLDVNLPELNLSESDSSDESDSGMPEIKTDDNPPKPEDEKTVSEPAIEAEVKDDVEMPLTKMTDLTMEKSPGKEEEQPDEQKVLDIWDNFKKYQATTEPLKEKTPPRVPIRKHVCESDHDYCIVPIETIEDDPYNLDKKKKKKSRKVSGMSSSSSSSSSSDSGSSCSCVSNCSCSSSSGSSSSSSSDSDSSGDLNHVKRKKRVKTLSGRRASNGSNVDVMGVAETPLLVPDKIEPQVAETDLETDESDTDEEFYDEHPQKLANKLHAEKKNQLLLLATVAPSDGGSVSGEASRPVTPIKEEQVIKKEKSASSKKKSKKKKKKSSRKHAPIKINIPKDIIPQTSYDIPPPLAAPNKITISLQSNTVQVPPQPVAVPTPISAGPNSSSDNKRSSKRRRVPNKFYGYSSDEEAAQATPLKPHLPPKLEWRKEDLPSPVTHKPKKETPTTLPHKSFNYTEPFRLKAPPLPDPEPPKILMNTESMESSDSDSSDSGSGGLQIYQPPVPPPMYLTTGTSSLPYSFQRPAGRQAREGESVYCYCRCPYDEVSEMIACDAEGCSIEWFHFECVGIMVPPKGKWYCPECRKKLQFSGFR